MQLIKEMLAKIEMTEVNGFGDKLGDVRNDEKVLCVLPEELQRFYVVMDNMYKEHSALIMEKIFADIIIEESKNDAYQCCMDNETMATSARRIAIVRSMFWEEVYEVIPEAHANNHVSLRKGFQVVSSPIECSEIKVAEVEIPLFLELAKLFSRN